MQNWFASFVLIVWPLVAICLYAALPFSRATLWTILGAQLVLPAGTMFKFEMIPQFDKYSIPNFCVLAGCLIVAQRPLLIWTKFALTNILIAAYLLSPILTSALNGDSMTVGGRILPGVGLYDALSAVEIALIDLIPFFLGRQFFRQDYNIRELFRAIVLSQLIYSILLLFEVRFSPQLHYWFYGYYPSDFVQTLRESGFRPMAFMGHGLLAASFVMMAVVASTAMWRAGISIRRWPPAVPTAYLAFVLFMCKSLGATVYAATFAPLVRFASPRLQLRVAAALAFVALLYPTLREFDMFPTDLTVAVASTLSTDRAISLKERFDNEGNLLARATERPVFGWGRFGRSRLYDEETGKDLSVTDGRWIITIGQFGFFGFLAEFGLLSIGIFRATSAIRYTKSPTEKIFLSSLALIVAINILDLLPNSGLRPFTWLITGALLGRAEALTAGAKIYLGTRAITKPGPAVSSTYSRQ
jgi:hypothetical protein